MTILLWLVKYLGVEGITGLVKGLIKWTVRLVFLLLLLVVLVVLWNQLSKSEQWRDYAIELVAAWLVWKIFQWSLRTKLFKWALGLGLIAAAIGLDRYHWVSLEDSIPIAVLGLAGAAFQWWWRSRKGEADVERTIDGKTVPDKLAVAALPIPARSPDGEYVLRGLPDYGKSLLKLTRGEFEYVPEIPEQIRELPNRVGKKEGVLQSLEEGLELLGELVFRLLGRPWVNGFESLGELVFRLLESPWVKVAVRWHSIATFAVAGLLFLGVGGVAALLYWQENAAEQKSAAALHQLDARSQQLQDSKQISPELADAANRTQDSQQVQDSLTWTDSETGLTWTTTDNGQPVNWQEAKDYCEGLVLDGPSNRRWRLPTGPEVADLWSKKKQHPSEVTVNMQYFEFGHGFRLSHAPVLWMDELDNHHSGYAYVFLAYNDGFEGSSLPVDTKNENSRAVCVNIL